MCAIRQEVARRSYIIYHLFSSEKHNLYSTGIKSLNVYDLARDRYGWICMKQTRVCSKQAGISAGVQSNCGLGIINHLKDRHLACRLLWRRHGDSRPDVSTGTQPHSVHIPQQAHQPV